MRGYTGLKVAFQASNGQYVCAERGGGHELVANRDTIGPWETFTFHPEGRSPQWDSSGRSTGYFAYDYLRLTADNGQYWCAEGGASPHELVANRDQSGKWERFRLWLVDAYRDEVLGGKRPLLDPLACLDWAEAYKSDSDAFSHYEDPFNPYISDGRFVALGSAHWELMVTAENGGGLELAARTAYLGPWEIFTLRVLSKPSEIYEPRDERFRPRPHGPGITRPEHGPG